MTAGWKSGAIDESINGNSQTTAGKVSTVEAGQQVQIKAGANVLLDAGASITLRAGGHQIVIDEAGIFSSTEIVTGGKSSAGNAAESPATDGAGALAARPTAASTEDLEDGELEEEEEEVELEDETPAGITLRIGVFFDGTGNNKANCETVAACYAPDANLAEAAVLDFTGANSRSPGLNLKLPEGCANKVVHLVARDEYRENFALNSLGEIDLVLPGVTSPVPIFPA